MKEEIRSELGSVLKAFDETDEQHRETKQKARSDAVGFLEKFYRLRESVIWPAMIEVDKFLKEKGHDTKIDQADDDMDPAGTGVEGSITMYFYPNGVGFDSDRAKEYPYISFVASRYNFHVWLNVNTKIPSRKMSEINLVRGSSGPRGQHPMEEITTEFVQQKVVGIVKEVFR